MDSKACTNCGEVKPLSDFYKRNRGKYYCSTCKVCDRAARAVVYHRDPAKAQAATKAWYEKNREKAKVRERRYREKNRERLKEINKRWCLANPAKVKANHDAWVAKNRHRLAHLNYEKRMRKLADLIDVRRAEPCADCGRRFPFCAMDFDHRDPSTKRFNVTSSAYRPRDELIAEMNKCDVVCSNCHRVRTALRSKISRDAVMHERTTTALQREQTIEASRRRQAGGDT